LVEAGGRSAYADADTSADDHANPEADGYVYVEASGDGHS
jgi:hypothetical protein